MKTAFALAALTLGACGASAQTTILDDQFTRSGSSNLFGSAPDTVDPVIASVPQTYFLDTSGTSSGASTGTAGGGSATLTENGTNGGSTNAVIDFSSSGLTAANTLYTLTLNAGAIAHPGGGPQLNFGFVEASGTSALRGTSYWVQTENGGFAAAYQHFNYAGSLNGGTGAGQSGSTGANVLTLTFNTSTDVFSYYANGNLITTYTDAYGDEANLNAVMLDFYDPTTGGGSETVSNLVLTETSLTPEPSTVALLLVGGVAACIFGWRRHRLAL